MFAYSHLAMYNHAKVKKPNFRFVVLFSFLLCTNPEFAEGEPSKASLIIVGPGDAMYEYWGHIGVAIEYDLRGTNLFYDFGNFSFYADNFYGNFIMGRMIYLSSVTPMDSFISRTISENRSVSLYPLNLGTEELHKLDATLRWWVLPENREYLYDYFLNNCSTIIRDILNSVTGDALRIYTESVPDKTYRHYARTGARPSFFNEVLLHFLLGKRQDEKISVWDSMFLPQAVADTALDFEYLGSDGVIRVLAEEEIVLASSTRTPIPQEPRKLWPWLLALSITLGLLWNTGRTLPRVFVILFVGIPGLILGFLMIFTDHMAAYNNINILPSLPTILLGFIPLAISAGGRRIVERELALGWIWTLNLTGLLVSIFLRLSGFSTQSAGAFWALYGPLTFIASWPGQYLKRKLNLRLGKFGGLGDGYAEQIRPADDGD